MLSSYYDLIRHDVQNSIKPHQFKSQYKDIKCEDLRNITFTVVVYKNMPFEKLEES